MAPLKILIIGGGIAGPALAYWLSKIDRCAVTIIERSPDLRASGQQVDLRGQGLEVMRRMGIEPQVRAKLVDEQGFKLVDGQGRTRAVFEANKSGKGRQGATAEFEIMRGDIVRILYDLSRDKATWRFGALVEGLEQNGDGVSVRFSDGSSEDFDLVVGADGQGSRTRRLMMGPGAADPFHFLNLYVSYYTLPQTGRDENYATALLLPKNRVASTRVDNPKTKQAYLAVYDPNGKHKDLEEATRGGDQDKQKAVWAELFKDVSGWEVPHLIDGMLNSPEAADFYNQKVGQVKLDRWSKGRIVLLGDAAYCASPVSGIGTSLGLVGPYVLAGEIARHLNQEDGAGPSSTEAGGRAIDAALTSYETVLRPLITAAQKLPWGVPGVAYAETEWGVWLRYLVVGLVSTLRINKLFERFSSDDFGGGWKLPDYPELRYEPSTRTA